MRGVGLVVLHVRAIIDEPYARGAMLLPPVVAGHQENPARRAAPQAVAAVREAHPDLDVRLELVEDDPAHALIETSRGASLLVVGSRGLGAFRGMLLGSVSNDVVRNASTVVMVVHGIGAG